MKQKKRNDITEERYIEIQSIFNRIKISFCISLIFFSLLFLFPLSIRLVPTEMGILLKEHFNRWYSLKAYYISVTLLDLPISVIKMEMKKKIGPNYQL